MMIIVCIFVVLFFLAFLFVLSAKWSQKTVKAFAFLSAIADGQKVENANELVKRIDLYAASELQTKAMVMVNEVFGGSQLKLISYARLEGFNQ